MTMIKNINDKDLMKKGVEILFKELGYTDAIRFLSIPRDMREESVKRHRKWQSSLDKNTFFDQIFKEKELSLPNRYRKL